MPPLSPDSTNCSSGASVESVALPCMTGEAAVEEGFNAILIEREPGDIRRR